MNLHQFIALVAITLLPVFAFVALKDGLRSMLRVLAIVLAVFAWVIVVALGVLKLVP
jgi:hypothetical protein